MWHSPLIRAPGPLRRFRGPMLSGVVPIPAITLSRGRAAGQRNGMHITGPRPGQASCAFAAASIAASDLRTWLRSVVYQKSGSDAFR